MDNYEKDSVDDIHFIRVILHEGDQLVIGAESLKDEDAMYLRALNIGGSHPWNGHMIRDLDISRQTFIVIIKREGRGIIPKGDTVIRAGDELLMYSRVTEADDRNLDMDGMPIELD